MNNIHDITPCQSWKPTIFDLNIDAQAAALNELKSLGAIWKTSNRIGAQLTDLIRTRNPQWQREPASVRVLEAELQVALNHQAPELYGRWVYYPWSGELVHLLAKAEFNELRLNRNRNKLTQTDQHLLAQKTIGIVGLSVGNAIAVTLALEGIGGHLRLADHDHLDLSNMNRIRAGVSDLGLAKTSLCARQIFEMNPYADISLMSGGLDETNLKEFFEGDQALDIVIDECDDIRMKLMLRETAKAQRIPVLMETSDRGMLDIERFDLEPERPVFHGLIGQTKSRDIPAEMSPEDRLRYVAPIVGIDSLSTRSAASMLEIGETLSTWPQLGSEVQLGAASVAAAVKRLILTGDLVSGRQYLDLNRWLKSREDPLRQLPRQQSAAEPKPMLEAPAVREASDQTRISKLMRFLTQHAVMAPSGGNSQPWCFYTDNQDLWVAHDQERSENLIDSDRRGAYVALGAAIKNIELAASHKGYKCNIDYAAVPEFPIADNKEIVARVRLSKRRNSEAEPLAPRLYKQIKQRLTDRKVYGHKPLASSARIMLLETAESSGCKLILQEDPKRLAEIGTLVGEADRLRMLFDDTHRQMMAEIRWSEHTNLKTRDGIDVATLDLSLSELTALQIVKRRDVAKFMRNQGGATVLTQLSHNATMASSAVGLISVPNNTRAAQIQGGRAIEQLWLLATSLGLAWHPITALIYLFNADLSPRLSASERSKLVELCERFERLFPKNEGDSQLMLFRLSDGHSSSTRSLRRPLENVLFPIGKNFSSPTSPSNREQ